MHGVHQGCRLVSKFYPSLAHTDMMGYLNGHGQRRLMSIRKLLPPDMSKRFLTSLSFDESIHYRLTELDGDPWASELPEVQQIEEIFVDCGAFHYSRMKVPRFRGGGFVSALTSIEEYRKRHLSREAGCSYLLCSPDHIIPPNAEDDMADARTEFTLVAANEFIEFSENEDRATPVGVVHGRTEEERASMTQALIDIGYDYIAFGGLVPLAGNQSKVLGQLTGNIDLADISIEPDSPLGIARAAGARTHMFGLTSPDWYRWWKRLGVDSFDGSKLSYEGAASGVIWLENEFPSNEFPSSAKQLYRRLQVKMIKERRMVSDGDLAHLKVSDDGAMAPENPAWRYLMSSRCTSPTCPHGPQSHAPDPRVVGSIEHNMGRTLLNAWTFDSIMKRIDDICERAKTPGDDENLQANWSPIEVE